MHCILCGIGLCCVVMFSVYIFLFDVLGGGDVGGLNVYVVEIVKWLVEVGIVVEIFMCVMFSD